MKVYQIKFIVEGRGTFPFDMLRYDACYPQTPESAAFLHSQYDRTRRRIELVHLSDNRFWLPTEGRWKSFLWSIDPESFEVGQRG